MFDTKTKPSAEILSVTFTFFGKSIFTFCPLTIRDVTSFADFKSSNSASNFWDIVSTAIFPVTSELVVITGTSFKIFASECVNSFAPPRWPDKREITKCFPSSIKSTAGSLSFVPIKLAIFLITIPLAIIKICPSYCENFSFILAVKSSIWLVFSTSYFFKVKISIS